MKKVLMIIIIILSFALISCSEEKMPNNNNQEENKEPDEKKPEEVDIYYVLDRFLKEENYQGISNGVVTTKVLFMNYDQAINSIRIKTSEGVFNEVITYSSFVKEADQFFFTGNTVYHREGENIRKGECNWLDKVNTMTNQEYLDAHGSYPYVLTHFILNEETILENNISFNDSKYTFMLTLDLKKAPLPEIVNMENTLGKDANIEFISIKMEVTADSYGRALSLKMWEEYYAKVPVLGKVKCSSVITEEFKYDNIVNNGNDIFKVK